MRFLKDIELSTIRGKPFIIAGDGPLAGLYTIGKMANLLVKSYSNQGGPILNIDDYRNYPRLEDVLDAGPKDGWYQIDDPLFDLLVKIAENLAPRATLMEIAFNSPIIIDVLKDATRRIPPELNSSSSNGHQVSEVEVIG